MPPNAPSAVSRRPLRRKAAELHLRGGREFDRPFDFSDDHSPLPPSASGGISSCARAFVPERRLTLKSFPTARYGCAATAARRRASRIHGRNQRLHERVARCDRRRLSDLHADTTRGGQHDSQRQQQGKPVVFIGRGRRRRRDRWRAPPRLRPGIAPRAWRCVSSPIPLAASRQAVCAGKP